MCGTGPGARESFLRTLQELALSEAAPTLVLVTHHVEEIMPAFTQLLVLDSGRVVASGATQSVLDDRLIARLYDGAVSRLVRHHGRCWPIGH